ncbi:MAG: Ribosomal silencing factor RsfS [Candidatus Anoxychlamydiales bacterium]|nr:Ribosomal silencing factor RsfS [Candidatus Anoxychlamydiales bacterium]NGX36662.1 Ribosomal silencing factor RsfS [Candidatus Anoxychlamydiales bacterium]
MDPIELINIIAQIIYDKKGFNILALDVKGISSITDYLIIAEGSVERHVKAISNEIIEELKKLKEMPLQVEGRVDADWIVIDYLNVMVHLFKPEMRELYALERLWSEGKIIDLKIKVENQA